METFFFFCFKRNQKKITLLFAEPTILYSRIRNTEKNMIKFIEKPISSAPSVAFLIVATALLKNVSQIAAASLAASDDLINAEGGRTRCSADGETVKELFDEYLVPVLDVYAERFPWTQQAAYHGMDRNNNIIEWNWAVRSFRSLVE